MINMGCAQSTSVPNEYADRNVHTSTNKRLVFGLKFGRGDQGGIEAKVLSGYESGFRRAYDSDTPDVAVATTATDADTP